jgi:Holliday junction resolvase
VTPEGKVKKAMTEGLDQLAAYWFFPATHGYGRSGVPDIIACIDGKFWAFECKADSGTATGLQLLEIEKIQEAGGRALIVRGVEGVEHTLAFVEYCIGRVRDRSRGTAAKSRRSKTGTRLRAD